MKITLQDCWYMFLITFVMWPWALLLVEGLAIFFTGVPLTAIPWNGLRVVIALIWPVIWGMFVASVSG